MLREPRNSCSFPRFHRGSERKRDRNGARMQRIRLRSPTARLPSPIVTIVLRPRAISSFVGDCGAAYRVSSQRRDRCFGWNSPVNIRPSPIGGERATRSEGCGGNEGNDFFFFVLGNWVSRKTRKVVRLLSRGTTGELFLPIPRRPVYPSRSTHIVAVNVAKKRPGYHYSFFYVSSLSHLRFRGYIIPRCYTYSEPLALHVAGKLISRGGKLCSK